VTQSSDFFSYYRLNLFNGACPYFGAEGASCGNIACAVSTIMDEQAVPAVWRMSELSKLEGPKAQHPDRAKQVERGNRKPLQGGLGEGVGESCVVEYDDECDERDYCVPEDESATAKGDYVSLVDNPERFTGYAGEHAHLVWDAIYRENCFTMDSALATTRSPFAPQAASDLRSVLKSHAGPTTIQPDDTCLEKRVFHRIISGMHASISTHICYEYLNQSTGIWSPNLECYTERLHHHPERVANLYFNYALVTRAVAKLVPYLGSYTFCSGDPRQNVETKQKILSLAKEAAASSIFDESLMFRDRAGGVELKEDFKQRFRNVSRIMDCVGCDKCRLWGKLQTAGYGTALKVLFELEDGQPSADGMLPLKRTELVALVNTMARIGKSLRAIAEFKTMLETGSVPYSMSLAFDHQPSSSPQLSYSSRRNASSRVVEVDDDDEFDTDELHEESTWELMKAEISLVSRTILFVFQEWFGLPKKLGLIFTYQASRAWSYWLGLEMAPPLQWELNYLPFMGREEL